MKFKRISEKQIQCLISQEELEEKGIAIDDFLDHRDKTEEFLREVVDEAQDVLDIEEMGHYFSVQMHILKTGNISLIINLEGDEARNPVLDDILETAEKFGKFKEKYGKEAFDDLSNNVIKDMVDKLMQAASLDDDDESMYMQDSSEYCKPKAERAAEKIGEEYSDKILGGKPVLVRMESLDDCIRMSKALKDVKCSYSKLYKYDEEYYIEIAFVNDEKFVAGQIMTMCEYADEIFTFDEGGALIEEHGKQIIAEDAVAALAKL